MSLAPPLQGHGRGVVLRLRLPPWVGTLARARGRGGRAALLCVMGLGLWSGTGYDYAAPSAALAAAPAALDGSDAPTPSQLRRQLERERRSLQLKLRRHLPRGTFIVIDQTHNRLYLRRGDEVLLEAVCSAGSGMILEDDQTERRWVFDTPRGHFRVLTKLSNPVWKKPDWAFIEEGEPIPTDPSERFEYGMLGEYAIYFGDGYLIHGTLYERLLGRSVTHGCIRLGRDDLRKVYAAARLASSIYIY